MKGPYKPGQKVRVRADLVVDRIYSGITFMEKHNELSGQIARVAKDTENFLKKNPPLVMPNGTKLYFGNEMLEEMDDE